MSAWMMRFFPGYNFRKAPAVLMAKSRHRATVRVYINWRARMARKMGGKFDWYKVGEREIKALAERMFRAAGVPARIRREYWTQYERMKAAIIRDRKLAKQCRRDKQFGGAMSIGNRVFTAEEMKKHYGAFYRQSDKVSINPNRVPPKLRVLIPYAEFWGLGEEGARMELMENASQEILSNLKAVVTLFDARLEAWLVRSDEAKGRTLSDEYAAFSALVMAADAVDWDD